MNCGFDEMKTIAEINPITLASDSLGGDSSILTKIVGKELVKILNSSLSECLVEEDWIVKTFKSDFF